MKLWDAGIRRASWLLAGGSQMAISVAAMVWLGSKLDAYMGTEFLWTLGGAMAGLAGGMWNLVRVLRHLEQERTDDEH